MKIEDLIELIKNRLTNFQLAKDYARMNGNLEAMNAADKEIATLEDTLYQLNLLVDASKSATVKESTLAEVITDGSVSVLSEYDISSYATDPEHEQKIMDILTGMGIMDIAEKIDDYIKNKYESSPITGEMILTAASAYSVDVRLMMALMELDSRFGTAGIATSTLNPGNIGNDDDGNTRTYESWQEGVTAVAEWLNRHRVIENVETVESKTATTTPEIIIPTEPQTEATTTPEVASTTPETATATSTPEITPEPVATTTPETISTATSTTTSNQTTVTATSTGQTATTTAN